MCWKSLSISACHYVYQSKNVVSSEGTWDSCSWLWQNMLFWWFSNEMLHFNLINVNYVNTWYTFAYKNNFNNNNNDLIIWPYQHLHGQSQSCVPVLSLHHYTLNTVHSLKWRKAFCKQCPAQTIIGSECQWVPCSLPSFPPQTAPSWPWSHYQLEPISEEPRTEKNAEGVKSTGHRTD